MGQTGRSYTTEFKIEAVRLFEAGGRSSAEVARSLGIDDGLLRNLRRQYGRNGGVVDLNTAEVEKEEVRHLRPRSSNYLRNATS